MLGLPKGDDFAVLLNDSFLYPEIKDRYKPYFDKKNFVFQNMIDYINSSIIGVNLTAISGSTNIEQNKKGITYPQKSGLKSINKINKQLRITFQLKRGFMNWFILNDQLSYYIDNKGTPSGDLTGDDTYLPPISIFFMDDDGDIIFERIHKNIVMVEIDDLSLVKTDNKVNKKEFTVTFYYGEWDNKYNIVEVPNIIKQEYSY